MLKIPIEQIGAEVLEVDEPLTEAWLAGVLAADPIYAPRQAAQLRGQLQRMDDTVHLSGAVKLALTAACVRCLGTAELALDVPLQLTLVPAEAMPKAAEDGALGQDDVGVGAYDGHTVDLEASVRDEVLLALPQRPFCRDDCAGLCGRCGHNLNQSPCSCAPEVDLRWQALQQMQPKA